MSAQAPAIERNRLDASDVSRNGRYSKYLNDLYIVEV